MSMESQAIDLNNNNLILDVGTKSDDIVEGTNDERVKVDRKKFEKIINENKEIGSADEFFKRIMAETNTTIIWPSKLKSGTKSKKDPHIRIIGIPENVNDAREKILDHLDSRKNRVTLKMDVAYTDHSHIIGKGGRSIQKVMNDTGCHIHFPDSNRTNTVDKSNQVSIAGTAQGAEQARCRIRELLPLTVHFELPINGYKVDSFDHSSPPIQTIQQTYGISINIRIAGKGNVFGGYGSFPSYASISVRGTRAGAPAMKQGLVCLIEYLLGPTPSGSIVFTLALDVAAQHHSFVMGRANVNLRTIMHQWGVMINFPDPNGESPATGMPGSLTLRKSTVFIKGTCFDSLVQSWQDLLGLLPLVLIFDLKEGQHSDAALITQMMKDYDVTILVKQKPKQNSGRCITVRGAERDSRSLFEVRRQILGLEESEVPVCCQKHTLLMMAKLMSSLMPQYNMVVPKNNMMVDSRSYQLLAAQVLAKNSQAKRNVDTYASRPFSMSGNTPRSQARDMGFTNRDVTLPQSLGSHALSPPNETLFGLNSINGYNSNQRETNFNHLSQFNKTLSSPMDSPVSNTSSVSVPSPLGLSPPNRSLSAIFGNLPHSVDKSIELNNIYSWQKMDSENRKLSVTKMGRENVKPSEPHTPTSLWSGFGLSKSMPHDILKSRLDSCRALAPVEESPQEFFSDSQSRPFWDTSSYAVGGKTNGGKQLRKQASFDSSYSSGYGLSFGSSVGSCSSLLSNSSDPRGNFFNQTYTSKSIDSDYSSPSKHVDISEILISFGLSKYVDLFQGVDIDFNSFLNLNDADLEELGISFFGRRKISSAIAELKRALQDHEMPNNHFEAAPGAERKQIDSNKPEINLTFN
ncbi:protein bicaudal C isoform X2 [Brevipalpus obovatus]|uniref:protein bicaudal C isoform X2 n=1 Tax=Brevipalpus obovatus TaxID=246614 RepID=UPI003D9E9149